MSCTRKQIVAQAQSWLGLNEKDGSFKIILDTYNSHKPLARGYKIQYTDAWCACFVSACAVMCNATDIIPTEVSCNQMIELLKKKGIWVENDAHVPLPGDLMFYDWQDDGKGDNVGKSDHVGIVETVSKDGKIVVIEGNYSDSVKRRNMEVDKITIRGYGTPDYDEEPVIEEKVEEPVKPTKPVEPVKPVEEIAIVETSTPAMNFLKTLAGEYTVTASALNIRYKPCIAGRKMTVIPKGTKVKCYGYYTLTYGVKWLYIQFIYKNVRYTGFASSKYLKK